MNWGHGTDLQCEKCVQLNKDYSSFGSEMATIIKYY